jgi:hypothetical protein
LEDRTYGLFANYELPNAESAQMKMRFFFPLLIFVLVSAACAGEAGHETAVNTSAARRASSTPVASVIATTEKPTAAPSATAAAAYAAPSSVLPIMGPAPTWKNDVWINSEKPLPLEELRGKVVLLEFWTFG